MRSINGKFLIHLAAKEIKFCRGILNISTIFRTRGMHICVMYIFCTVMCVETSFIYNKARKLLMAACPSGSLVALWQLATLLRYTDDIRKDTFGQLVAVLLSIRIASGFIQTVGLFQLKDLRGLELEIAGVSCMEKVPSSVLNLRLKQLRSSLFCFYLPMMVVYIFVFALLGNCHLPLVSNSIFSDREECSHGSSADLNLAQNWPGMGLFFHYGMITVIFTANGARKGKPSYAPSLHIASLFSIHVFALIFAHLCWDAMQTDLWHGVSGVDWLRRVLVIGWMVVSGVLWLYCEKLSDVRLVQL